MYIVGMFVMVDPDSFDLVVPEIKSFCNVDVQIKDQESGKLVLAITTSHEQKNKLIFEKIKSLPFVTAAEIIYFYRYDEMEDETVGEEGNNLARKELQTYKSYNSIIHTRH
ncbi:chaperone NapD [Kaarinaea lacus]